MLQGKYSRSELAGKFRQLTEAGRPMQFVAEVYHDLGLVTEEGELSTDENGVPTLLKNRKTKSSQYNLQVLTEAMLGSDWSGLLGLNSGGKQLPIQRWMRESDASPISPSTLMNVNAWSNTIAGLIQASILEGYESAEYDLLGIFPSVPAKSWDNEKLISVLGPMEPAQKIAPGQPHPPLKLDPMWVQTGQLEKFGFSILVTKETAWADITGGQVLDKAKQGGMSLAYRENELILDILTGVTNNFRLAIKQEDSATGYNTYGATINGVVLNNDYANPLRDWSTFYSMDNRVGAYVHPAFPNVPINVELNTLIVPHRLKTLAELILGAEDFDMGTQPGSPLQQLPNSSSVPSGITKTKNPYKGRFKVISSRWLDRRHAADGLTGDNLHRFYAADAGKTVVRRVGWEQQTYDVNPNEFEMANLGIIAGQIGDLAVQYQVRNPWGLMRCKNS